MQHPITIENYFKHDDRERRVRKPEYAIPCAESGLPGYLPHRTARFLCLVCIKVLHLVVPSSFPLCELSQESLAVQNCLVLLRFVYKSNAIPPSFCSAALVSRSFKKQTNPLPLFSSYFFCSSDGFHLSQAGQTPVTHF